MKRILSIIAISATFLGAQQITGLSNWTLYLDPGHSQKENMGIYNYSEAEKNVRVSNELHDLLTTFTDIEAVYRCRTNDNEYVGLYDRQNDANALGVDWYHSIHSDAGAPNSNSTLLLYGELSPGTEKTPRGGKAMSDIMIGELTKAMRTYTAHGSIGDCSFYGTSSGPYLAVNRRTNMPSELSEAGFHTNPTQNQRNMNADWKRLEAWSLFWTILEYHGLPHVSSSSLTGIIKDQETGKAINAAIIKLSNGLEYSTDSYESLFNIYSNDPDLLSNGFYYFEGIEENSLEMIVNAAGYYPDTLTAELTSDRHNFLDVRLISSAAPVITNSTPANGSVHPAWDPLIIDFSRPMDTASVNHALSIEPAAPMTIYWTENDRRMLLLADLDFDTDYSVRIQDSAQDVYGHSLNADSGGGASEINFRSSGEDIDAPELKRFYADEGILDASLTPSITFMFDEALDTSSLKNLNYQLVKSSAPATPLAAEMLYYDFDSTSVITIFSLEDLKPATNYKVSIGSGISDLHGNTTESGWTREITTRSTGYLSTKVLDSFNTGVGNFWEPQQSGSTTGIMTGNTSRSGNTDIVYLSTGSTRSMQVNYGWDKNAGGHLIRVYGGHSSIANNVIKKERTLQCYIFGDGSGNPFRFCVDDAGGTEVSPWYDIDWYGWKLVSWNLTKGETGSWIGDGTLNGDMTFDSFQFSYAEGSPNTGTLYLDEFMMLTPETQTKVEAIPLTASAYKLKQNYPNPFNGATLIDIFLPIAKRISLDLYSLRGEHIKTLAAGDYPGGNHTVHVSSSDLASGMYFYQLTVDGKLYCKRLTVLK